MRWHSSCPRLPGVSLLIVLCWSSSPPCSRSAAGTGLQFLEFHAYDFFIRHQPKAATSDPIVLVEMTEADIHSPALDYPIYDDKLAELLSMLEAQSAGGHRAGHLARHPGAEKRRASPGVQRGAAGALQHRRDLHARAGLRRRPC